MKRAILVFLLGLSALVSQAEIVGPVKGLVDAGTGAAIPDARDLFLEAISGNLPKTITVGPSQDADFDNLEDAIVEAVKVAPGFAGSDIIAEQALQNTLFVIEVENGTGYTLPPNFVVSGLNAIIRAENNGQVTVTIPCDPGGSLFDRGGMLFYNSSVSFIGLAVDASDCVYAFSTNGKDLYIEDSTVTAGVSPVTVNDAVAIISDSTITSEGKTVPGVSRYGAVMLYRNSRLELSGNTTINGHTEGVMVSFGDSSMLLAPTSNRTITIRGSQSAIFFALNNGGGNPTAVIQPPNYTGNVVLESAEGLAIESTPTARVTYRGSKVTFNGDAIEAGDVNQPLNKLLVGGGFVSDVEGDPLSLVSP